MSASPFAYLCESASSLMQYLVGIDIGPVVMWSGESWAFELLCSSMLGWLFHLPSPRGLWPPLLFNNTACSQRFAYRVLSSMRAESPPDGIGGAQCMNCSMS